jgi:hypothetical protein
MGVQPGKQPAIGVPGQYVGRRDAGREQQLLQVADLVRGVVHAAAPDARAEPGAVVRAGAGRARQVALRVAPVAAAAAESRLQHDHRDARARAGEVELVAADVDQPAAVDDRGRRVVARVDALWRRVLAAPPEQER